MDITQYKYLTVRIYSFRHDVNGNSIAKHSIELSKEKGVCSVLLNDDARRVQTGYGQYYSGAVLGILTKFEIDVAHLSEPVISGSRSDDCITITYIVKSNAALTNNQKYINEQFDKLTLSDTYKPTIKIWASGETNCMSVTNEQLEAIKQILMNGV